MLTSRDWIPIGARPSIYIAVSLAPSVHGGLLRTDPIREMHSHGGPLYTVCFHRPGSFNDNGLSGGGGGAWPVSCVNRDKWQHIY